MQENKPSRPIIGKVWMEFDDDRDHYTLHFYTSLDDHDLHSSYRWIRNQKLLCPFPCKLLKELGLLPPVGLWKLMLNLFCTINILGRELYVCDFMK